MRFIEPVDGNTLVANMDITGLEYRQYKNGIESRGPFSLTVIRDGQPVTLNVVPDPSHLQGE